jgi:preprotein translocase subunit SecG
MLSFLQDNNRDDLVDTAGPEGTGTEANEDQNGDGQEYLAPAEHGKNAKRTTIILVILFSVGSLCIWFMIKKAAPRFAAAAVSTEEAQIENAIAQLTGIKTQMNSRIDQMLGQFYQFADVDQVGVGQLKKNPFRHELYVSDFESLLDKEPDISTGTDLQLWGILQTEQGNCCMINEKILYEGDRVSGLKVVRIGGKHVELVTASGSPVILKIPE